tara:strand:- start:2303 stop:2659 length:357 start_codon:yes stop_codon:yes gene_type:complete
MTDKKVTKEAKAPVKTRRKSTTSANKRREVNKEELRRYLSENNKVRQIIKNIEKLEDVVTSMEPIEVTRINSAITHRLALLKKYLPDEKSIEIKNAEGESFKSDSKWTVEFVNANPED